MSDARNRRPFHASARFSHRDVSRAVRGLRWAPKPDARPEAPPTPPIAPAPATAPGSATQKEQ